MNEPSEFSILKLRFSFDCSRCQGRVFILSLTFGENLELFCFDLGYCSVSRWWLELLSGFSFEKLAALMYWVT